MSDNALRAAAEHLSRGRLRQEPITQLPETLRPADVDAAYDVQQTLHALYAGAGHGAIGGIKIGCTTPVMQRFLGINHPCAGGILAPTIHHVAGHFAMDRLVRPGVECEIAVRLSGSLPPQSSHYDAASVAPAVGAVFAAIEVVDDRYVDYRSFDTPTLIADDFFNAGSVLGPACEDWRALDLPALRGGMTINGEAIGDGVGRDIMGHPLAALAWLANHACARGKPLAEGLVVSLGSIVETRWVAAGDVVEVTLEGLGGAQARFE